MKDRITIDLHPATKVNPECAADQMAIFLDGSHIGYASKVEGGIISLIVNFEDQDVASIREAVGKLIGVTHGSVGMVPDLPDDFLDEEYDDETDEELEDMGSLENEDSE